jgi:hypothetical protein
MTTAPVSRANGLNHWKKLTCSHCGSAEVSRQRPRGLIERHFFRAFRFTPFLCATCKRRSYLRTKELAEQRA